MLKIGLTGGIGSGKTTVAQIFEVLGIPVYYADQAAKDLMNTSPKLRQEITDLLGAAAYKDGFLDRAYVAGLVFKDPEKLSRLNKIVHPATIQDANEWMKRQKTPYAIKEAALIFEGGLEQYFDFIIGVTAPESLRVERTITRDNLSSEEVLQRMRQQMDDREKMSRCDFVVTNDDQQAVLPQVLAIHEKLTTSVSPKRP
jgi:dephospho-CoA kinase